MSIYEFICHSLKTDAAVIINCGNPVAYLGVDLDDLSKKPGAPPISKDQVTLIEQSITLIKHSQ